MAKISLFFACFLLINTSAFGALLDGLQVHYTFDQTLNDSSGNNNDGVAFGGPTFSADKDGNANSAVSLDGLNDHIDVASLTRNSFSQLTITTWFRYTGATTDAFRTIIGSSNGDFFVGKNTGDTRFGVQDGPYNPSMITGSDAWDGEWHFIAYVANGNNGTLFLDGVTISGNSSFNSTAGGFLNIGKEIDNNHYFKGDVDDMRIFDRVLSNDEILQVQVLNSTVPELNSALLFFISMLVASGYRKFSK